MDTRYLESLLTVVELGSIARAARQQNLTAAAVGQRIQSLEKSLGVTLLERSAHSAKPTEACLNVLPRARRIVNEARQLANDADRVGLSGSFQLGAISTALTGVLPAIVRALAHAAPNLSLQIKPGVSKTLYTDLLDGELDAAIIVLPPQALAQSLTIRAVRREPLVLLSHAARGRSIEQKLKQNPYIRYDANSWGGQRAERYLLDKGYQPQAFCELDGLEAIEKLVQQQVGVSLVPAWAGLGVACSEVTVTKIANPRYARDVALVVPKNTRRPKVVALFTQLLADAGQYAYDTSSLVP